MSRVFDDFQLNVYNFVNASESKPAAFGFLRFDPNNTCNLHCVYCHNGQDGQVIDAGQFRSFLENNVVSVANFQMGCIMEPTVDPRLVEFIEIVSASPARPARDFILQTNGTMIHRHDQQRMAAAGLTRLSVSMDAADPSTQKSLRGGTSLTKVVDNVRGFIKACPGVSVAFISTVCQSNVDRLEDLVALGIDIGVKSFVFREMFYYPDNKVVDHSRMPGLLLMAGQFDAMRDAILERFPGKADFWFATNEELDKGARKVTEESGFVGRDLPTPTLHAGGVAAR